MKHPSTLFSIIMLQFVGKLIFGIGGVLAIVFLCQFVVADGNSFVAPLYRFLIALAVSVQGMLLDAFAEIVNGVTQMAKDNRKIVELLSGIKNPLIQMPEKGVASGQSEERIRSGKPDQQ